MARAGSCRLSRQLGQGRRPANQGVAGLGNFVPITMVAPPIDQHATAGGGGASAQAGTARPAAAKVQAGDWPAALTPAPATDSDPIRHLPPLASREGAGRRGGPAAAGRVRRRTGRGQGREPARGRRTEPSRIDAGREQPRSRGSAAGRGRRRGRGWRRGGSDSRRLSGPRRPRPGLLGAGRPCRPGQLGEPGRAGRLDRRRRRVDVRLPRRFDLGLGRWRRRAPRLDPRPRRDQRLGAQPANISVLSAVRTRRQQWRRALPGRRRSLPT